MAGDVVLPDKRMALGITLLVWAILLARAVFGLAISRMNEDFLFAAIALAMVYALDIWVSHASLYWFWFGVAAVLMSFPVNMRDTYQWSDLFPVLTFLAIGAAGLHLRWQERLGGFP